MLSTWVSAVEPVDEAGFIELANNAGIDQVFYFESRNFRILQRHQPLRIAQTFQRWIRLTVQREQLVLVTILRRDWSVILRFFIMLFRTMGLFAGT